MNLAHNINDLEIELAAYQNVTGKSASETLSRNARELSFKLSRELKPLAPAKGSIRADLESRLAAGAGIRVRPSIRAKIRARKRGSWLAMVRAEAGARERARGFLAYSPIRLRGGQVLTSRTERRKSRFGQLISIGRLIDHPQKPSIALTWSGSLSKTSSSAAEGLGKSKATGAINRALVATRDNMRVYLNRQIDKQNNALKKRLQRSAASVGRATLRAIA